MKNSQWGCLFFSLLLGTLAQAEAMESGPVCTANAASSAL